LDVEPRWRLASQVATAIRPVVRTSETLTDERLIERAAAAYRSRFANG
jgi:hypothetical protein